MKTLLLAATIALALGWTVAVQAQAPQPVTATCKDGSAFSGSSRRGACSGHGGVQAFTGAPAASSAAAPLTAAPNSSTPTRPAATPQSQGARAGQVWVNTASKVYHCPGTKNFGNTKVGLYMTEAAAKAEGDRPANGKVCFP